MLPVLITVMVVLAAVVLRLLSYRCQMEEMARILEETPAESNLCLTVRMPGKIPRRLCLAINARLESGRKLHVETMRAERELKYTMACISHDIRTPLAAVMGYLQLLDGEPERREEYLGIVKKRLEDIGRLLDELFLYTRLLNEPPQMECKKVSALMPLWEALAELYLQMEEAGVEPELHFAQEDLKVWASPEALGRVYRNLIANAVRHGGGGLTVFEENGEICFSNPLGAGPAPDPCHLFDRFYQSRPDRGKGGAGLGLAIVRELMEQMGGGVTANVADNELQIRLIFRR